MCSLYVNICNRNPLPSHNENLQNIFCRCGLQCSEREWQIVAENLKLIEILRILLSGCKQYLTSMPNDLAIHYLR